MVWVWIGRILLGLLLLLAVLLLIPLKIQVEIGLEEQRATLRYLFLHFPVYPFKDAEEAEQAEEDEVRAAKGKGKKGKCGKKTPLPTAGAGDGHPPLHPFGAAVFDPAHPPAPL